MLLPAETIQSQYSASPTILALADSARVRIAPDADIKLFYDTIFNIATAEGVGLDIWGRILGMGRKVDITELIDFFGFLGSDNEPFCQAPLWNGTLQPTGIYELTDDAYRQLLYWKAMANIATADAATLNTLLQRLFPGENIVVYEIDVMQLELRIYFPLLPWQRTILQNYGLIAKGAGVKLNWVEIPFPAFGFYEAGYDPFNAEPFWAGNPR